jgi:hypothetical protein
MFITEVCLPFACTVVRKLLLVLLDLYTCAKIPTERICKITEAVLLEHRHGFRKGLSCIDCIFAVAQPTEKMESEHIDIHIFC